MSDSLHAKSAAKKPSTNEDRINELNKINEVELV